LTTTASTWGVRSPGGLPDIGAVIDEGDVDPARSMPLWQLWIADNLSDGRIGVVGKVHHCMVDGSLP
jgi:diacylglycerol O-acyltransferase